MKLSELYSFNELNVFSQAISKTAPQGPDPALVYGVELEIENTDSDCAVKGFRAEHDGSLRNNGWEFITYPMNYQDLYTRLNAFFAFNKFTEDNYSERCSVHVHTNCRDLEFEQITSIILIYQVVEKLLFNFVGGDRDSNIFCVPLSETTITYRIIDKLAAGDPDPLRDWHKYTALNLLPLTNPSQGTIEWRHMPGNCNVEFILAWLRLIGHIYIAARNNTLTYWTNRLKELNSSSEYSGLLVDIFKGDAHFLMTPGYERSLEAGVLMLKYSLMPNTKIKKSIPSVDTMNWLSDALQPQTSAIAERIARETL